MAMTHEALVNHIIDNLCGRSGFDAVFDVDKDILDEIKQEMSDSIGAHLSAQAKVKVTLPDEPVRVRYEWSKAKLGECVSCGGRHFGVMVDGELNCASCIDASRLEEWKLYASMLRKIVDSFAARLSRAAQSSVNSEGEAVARLDKPALVGHAQFGVGIPWSTVIGAAQRAYEWKDDKITPQQISAFYIAFPHLAPSHEKVKEAAERADVPEGWFFSFVDDEGHRFDHYCATRDEVYSRVAEWMTGDRSGEAISDAGDDMVDGVTETLIETGAFHPEGDKPCFLRKVSAAPTLAGKGEK